MEYGVQLYSVRDITGTDMAGALKSVREQGYSFVEFAGFFGLKAEEVKALLEKNGLAVSGTHTGLKELTGNLAEVIAYHKAIGNTRIIVPYAPLGNQQQLDAFIETMNAVGEKLAAAGIRLGYHNHDQEFKMNSDGSVAFEQLVYRTGLDLEVDTYWAYVGGADPVALLKRLGSRVPVIHIKDGFANGEGMPLGQGTAPVEEVYREATAQGILMVVESETLKPDGLTETGICIQCLKALEKA